MKVLFLTNNPQVSNPLYEWLVSEGEDVLYESKAISANFLRENNIEFIVSYNYAYLIKKDVLDLLPHSVINLHISLLPYNKGASPNVWSFIDGTPCGVTIHEIDEGIDTGGILLQQQVSFDIDHETLRSSYYILHQTIQAIFRENWGFLKSRKITPKRTGGGGGYCTQTKTFNVPHAHPQLRRQGVGIFEKGEGFESTRLLYRGICAADAEDIVCWRSDPAVYKYFRVPEPLTIKNHLEWYESIYLNDSSRVDYVINEKERRKPIGVVYISDLGKGFCDIGYIIGERGFQRMGYATEAVDATVNKYAKMGVFKFQAEIHPMNKPSIKVVEKCGFSFKECLKTGFLLFKKEHSEAL